MPGLLLAPPSLVLRCFVSTGVQLLALGVSRWELPPQAWGKHAGISNLSKSCRSRFVRGFSCIIDICTRASRARQLQGVCQQVADKCVKQRGPGAVGPPQKIDYANKSFDEIEAENDAYFGLGTDEELEELPPPPRRSNVAANAPAPAPAAAAPARTPMPAPTPTEGVDRDGRPLSAPSRAQVFIRCDRLDLISPQADSLI